jgi:hypothetical protein
MFQVGNRTGLSYGGWLFLRFLSFFVQLFQTGRDSPISLESTRDRYAFPALKVSSFFPTYHFGGALQTDRLKPMNYIAMNTVLTSSYMPNGLSRMLFSRLQGHISDSITDFTYVIEGEHDDELPERALSSIRQVHIDPRKVARDPVPHIDFPDLTSRSIERESDRESAADTPGDTVEKIIGAAVAPFRSVAYLVTSPFRSTIVTSPLHLLQNVTLPASMSEENDGPERLPEPEDDDFFDPVERAIADVMGILDAVKVPSRLTAANLSITKSEAMNHKFPKEAEGNGLMLMKLVPVLDIMDRYDIERYIRLFDFDPHEASLRITQTAAWRGTTFPIDKRKCRIELQNGQFFQQGFDREKNPVYYFRNMCAGPWRMDEDAVISAILHRFDRSLREFCKTDPFTKVTVIVLMGAPRGPMNDSNKKGRRSDENKAVEDPANAADDDDEEDNGDRPAHDDEEDGSPGPGAPADEVAASPADDAVSCAAGNSGSRNPRISLDEQWKCHSNTQMMERLFTILGAHYPSRLAKALIVKGRGSNTYYRDTFQGKRKLRKLLGHQLVQDKIRFIQKSSALDKYVEVTQLVTIVGGTAPVDDSAYDF